MFFSAPPPRYTGPGNESNMAIVAVKMVSGYIPDKESIKQLKQQTKLGLKRYEVDKNWVNLYFDKVGSAETDFVICILARDM